jgi:hypothetical protein
MRKVRPAAIVQEKSPILREKSANADRLVGVAIYIAGFFAVGGSIPFNRR